MQNSRSPPIAGTIAVSPSEPSFPRNILAAEHYSVVRVLSLVILLISLISWAGTLHRTTFHRETIRQEVIRHLDNRGLLKKTWDAIAHFLWQRESTAARVERIVQQRSARARFWAFVRVLLAFALVWLTFDWDRARHFVFVAVAMTMSTLYCMLPVDCIPDAIPAVGVADDMAVCTFGVGLSAASIAEYSRRRRQQILVASLLESNPATAVNVVLSDYGLKLNTRNPE